MDPLIHYYKLFTEGLSVSIGDVCLLQGQKRWTITVVKAPKGEFGVYIVGGISQIQSRLKLVGLRI
jgi:hypothetical protein